MRTTHDPKTLVATCAAALVTVMMAAGCGSSSRPAARHAVNHRTKVVEHIDGSYATNYTSLTQLRQDAQSVALISPTSTTTTQMLGGVPWTVTTVTVQQTLSGSALPATIQLRQLGASTTQSTSSADVNGAPVVSATHAYIAYLQPYETVQNGPQVDGQYVVIGGLQGLFQGPLSSATATPSSAAGNQPSFTPVDPNSALPSTLSITQATASS